jgi:hypothetical protein
VTSSSSIAEIEKYLAFLLLKYGDLFSEVPDFQEIMGIQYIHQKPRTVPFAMKHMIEKELDGLEDLGVIQNVTYFYLLPPTLQIVPVIKSGKTLKLCAD